MLIPLSEDERLTLVAPREFYVLEGETPDWSDVTVIRPGERRAISLNIQVAPRARAQMVRTFEVPAGARLTILQNVKVGEAACWQNVICIRGRGEVKIRRAIEVFGPGAEVQLSCLGVMEQSGRISVSDEIFSRAPDTRNALRTKIVLNDGAQSEARGRIVIDEHSTKSTSYERLDHLVFGEHASAVAIPELEVKTDDVNSGHGATTSRPGEAELFYLTSRGLPRVQAEKLLARGFITEALRDVPEAEAERALAVLFG